MSIHYHDSRILLVTLLLIVICKLFSRKSNLKHALFASKRRLIDLQ